MRIFLYLTIAKLTLDVSSWEWSRRRPGEYSRATRGRTPTPPRTGLGPGLEGDTKGMANEGIRISIDCISMIMTTIVG